MTIFSPLSARSSNSLYRALASETVNLLTDIPHILLDRGTVQLTLEKSAVHSVNSIPGDSFFSESKPKESIDECKA
jgi:hypothetical protein